MVFCLDTGTSCCPVCKAFAVHIATIMPLDYSIIDFNLTLSLTFFDLKAKNIYLPQVYTTLR